jgi:Lrp/AsnC family transcriptional regulator, leucine-responsive regulatory protein
MLSDSAVHDPIDLALLDRLSSSGRATWADLGTLVGLSAAAVADRVRRLEERRVVRRYAAILDPRSLGFDVLAFVAVSLEHPKHRAAFLARVGELAEIQECHHVIGEDDYLLKVRCRDTAALETFLSDGIKGIQGVARTRTTLALSSAKETTALPLAPGKKPGARKKGEA